MWIGGSLPPSFPSAPQIHRAAFVLPEFTQKKLKDVRPASESPAAGLFSPLTAHVGLSIAAACAAVALAYVLGTKRR